jgi:predicted AlkP superfamily pyrophosphatase or phosphodiesterase
MGLALSVLLGAVAPPDPGAAATPPEHVVIVSIDGLRPEFYLGDYPTPTLKDIAAQGAAAQGVESVYPSVTYAAHASIITGVRPWKHGIYANTCWDASGSTRDWYWYARDLKARTLWQAAREKGKTVAITYWPSSVGAEADWVLGEIWDPDARETAKRLHGAATPGLLVELTLALGLPAERIADDKVAIDQFVSRAAAYIFRRYKPNLQLVHLLCVDDVQHKEGPSGEGVRRAVELQDQNVARIRRAIEDSGLLSKTALLVVGDHGFTEVRRNFNPNAVLRDAGLIEVADGKVKSWRALARSSGGSAAIYVKDPREVDRVADLLRGAQVHEGSKIFRVIDRAALDALGYNPDAAMALEPEEGWAFSGALASRGVEGQPTVKGNHGQLPSGEKLKTGFLACGAGIKGGVRIERMRVIDIAPTVSKLLGLDMREVEGSPLEAILK